MRTYLVILIRIQIRASNINMFESLFEFLAPIMLTVSGVEVY